MSSSLDQERCNGLLSQLLACLQPMEALHKNKALAISSDEDRTLQSDLQNAFGDFAHGRRIERRSTLNGNVNVGNCKGLALQHLSSCEAGASVSLDIDRRYRAKLMQTIMFKAFVRPIALFTWGTCPQIHVHIRAVTRLRRIGILPRSHGGAAQTCRCELDIVTSADALDRWAPNRHATPKRSLAAPGHILHAPPRIVSVDE